MNTRRLLTLTLGVALVVAACSPTTSTVGDIRGQSFDGTDELVAWLDCDGQWTRIAGSLTGPPGTDWNAKTVVDTAEEIMGTGEHPAAVDAVQAGNVWVLIDKHGQPFGGLKLGQDLTMCSGG